MLFSSNFFLTIALLIIYMIALLIIYIITFPQLFAIYILF